MTRKRFIKLMMARGYSRNLANYIAQCIAETNGQYKDQYNNFIETESKMQTIGLSEEQKERLSEAFLAFGELVARITNAFIDGVNAGVAAFNDSMLKREVKQ